MAKYLSDEEVFGTPSNQNNYVSDEEVFGSPEPKKKKRERRESEATALDYVKAIDTGLAQGVANIGAGVGTFIQAPAANTLSGVMGARALADRGITWLINQAGGESELNTQAQEDARMASRFAAEARAENADSAVNLPARLGRFMERDSRQVAEAIKAKERATNPELVRQQENMGQAEGFVDNVAAAIDNPLAFVNTLSRSVPDMAAGVGVGATLSRAGAGLGRVSTAGALSEAGSSAMQARENTYQQVVGMPVETLAAHSPRFKEILAETGGDAVRAREVLANELADQTPILSGVGTAAGTVLTNRLFGGDATAKSIVGAEKMTAKELGKRVAQDTVEEGFQGVPEDAVQFGATVQADQTKEYDPAGSLAQNMMAGLAMGSGGHGFAYARENLAALRGDPGTNDPNQPQGTQAGQAPADQAAQAPGVAGAGQQPTAGSADPGRTASAVEATGVGTADTEQAARALREPLSLTALDRANEIDTELTRITERQAELSAENGYGPVFDQERAELAAKAQELAQERESIAATWPKAQRGMPTSFSTEAGVRIDGQYALMDAADLVTSHDEGLRPNPLYPQELQPRDRSRSASEMQVSGIVQKLDPARLGLSADAATGAPIVGADGLVESGNARTIALKRVYQANGQKAEDYKQFLRTNAAQFGIDPAQVDGMEKPVLVRVRATPVNRAEFARQANASTVQRMSPSEQALSDSKRLASLEGLNPDDNGDFDTSYDFIRQFMAMLPVTEQSDMIESDGRLSTFGYRRIQNAVLAKAYGDSPTLRRMTESMDDNLRNITKALTRVAPTIAAARERMQAGTLYEADLAPDLIQAVEGLSSLKDKGWTVADELGQQDLTGPKYSPEAADLLTFLSDNIRSPRRIAEFMQRYYEALEQAGDPSQPSMFGDTGPAPKRADLLTTARGNQNGDVGQDPQRGIDREGARTAAQDGRQSEDAPSDRSRDQGDGAARADAGGAGLEGAAQGQADSGEWVAFPPESGTLGIPRREMPQVKGEHRGALINFLNARGIAHEQDTVPASSLKPTQAEFSREKVAKFTKTGVVGERSVLVSSDGYVLDGHHQWMGHNALNEDIPVIRLGAPIRELLAAVNEFPSVRRSEGGMQDARAAAVSDFKAALADLAEIASKHTRAAMLPENTPGLMPTLVRLFDAGIRIVGTDLKAATKWVKEQMKAEEGTRKIWNKIDNALYQKAALQALEKMDKPAQGGLFDSLEAATEAVQGDLFAAAPARQADKPKVAMIDGRPYDMKRDNFKPPSVDTFMDAGVLGRADGYVEKYYKDRPPVVIAEADRQRAEALLVPLLEKADDAKVEYDQKVIDITQRTKAIGQMIAPLKKIGRSVEKLVNEEKFDIGGMKDVLRSTIVVSSYDDAQQVLDEIEKEFKLLRKPKNRTGDFDMTWSGGALPAEDRMVYGGYSDVLVNVVMPNGVIAEIQINVPQMLSAKEGQGHKLYEAQREAPKDSPLGVEIGQSMTEFYDAAFAAARKPAGSSETAMPPAGPASMAGRGSNDAPSSDSLNQPSPGISTNQSPPKVGTNREPRGNFSGTLIGTPLDSNVPQITANGYTGANPEGDSDANGRTGEGGAQGEEPGAAQGTERQGRAQQVRRGSGRPDQRAGDNADAGAADQAGVGQAGPDGVRGQDEDGKQSQPRGRAGRVAGVPAGRDIPPKSGRNYQFGPSDLTYEGSWFKKAEQNVEAVELLQALKKEGRQASREEQAKLAKFIGWGASEIANNIFGDKLDKAGQALQWYEKAAAAIKAKGTGDLEAGGYKTVGYRRQYVSGDPAYMDAFNLLRAKDPALVWNSDRKITQADLDKAKPEAGTKRWLELRDRLKAVMSDSEWAEASRSTQYAHYTSKEVVKSMWAALDRMGFKGGSILEPGAGIGVFPGLMPEAMANNSIYTGVEFDTFTGEILKQLFPDERVLVESFVDSKLPKNFYDVAVGNPPFSGTKILSDPEYAKRAFSLHDYFFAKSIDRVKPGGLVVYVTSRYTMDKLDDKARAYLAERADLVGAIRLPQTAFKQNAGTEVVTDVIFLRKKVPGQAFDGAQSWAKSVPITVNGAQYNVNEYFAANPQMVLGKHSDAGSMYKDREYTVEPIEGDIEALFASAVEQLPANIYTAERGSSAEAAQVREIDFNPKAQKEGNYYVTDAGVLMVREGGVGQPVQLKSQKDVELVKDFVPLRDALKQAHHDQLNDGDWENSLKALQKAYADFTKKHGQINQFTTKVVKTKGVDEDTGEAYTDETTVRVYPLLKKLEDDPDYTLVAALETINDDTGEIKPSDFLTQRVLGKPQEATVNTPIDAMLSSLNDVGKVDIPLIAQRVGLSQAEAIEALGSSIYEDPETGWQTADEYLSGNVKRKLDAAREAAKADKRYERNVTALEAVQPAPKTPSQINIGIGMNWVPGDVYARFLRELAGVRARVEFNERTKQWIVQEEGGGKTMQATADWGTADRNITELLEHALTGRAVRITRSVGTGSDRKTVFDAAATEGANQKLEALKDRFSSWVWEDAERTDRLVKLYNDTFNTTVPRAFDGRHLTLPGSSKTFHIFDHVKRGAWRIIQRGNTYLAHAVGSGKTFQMVIANMEMKRLGLVNKPMVVVPNHMLKQFAHEWQMLYPAARLMVADENNFHTDNRRRFVSRVALSDLDGVVITHSAFKLLDLDPEFKAKMIEEQLEYMRAALEEAEDAEGKGGKKSPRIKQIEKQIENLEEKLKAAMSSEGKDKNVRFDELGVDFLMVDEAHEYRKLDFATARQVKGISPQGSARAFDLYMKSRYLEEKRPGRSLVMASGTPVTNTLAELYNVQRFMDRQSLIDRGIEDFDSWAAMFGRERTVLEPNAAGKYEPVTRFSKFVNVPELTQMFREFADVLTSDHLAALLGDKRPKVAGGSRQVIVTPKTEAYAEFQDELSQRVEASRKWKPSKDEPNNPDPMIRIIGDGRLAAIDMRFINPSLPSDPDSKLNRMIDDVVKALKDTEGLEYRDKAGNVEPNKGAAMMVFSDLGFGAGVAENRGFNARAWFEKRLRDAGVPMNQVAFMSDYKKSADKLKLFKDVNAGRVRLLVGSSKNMGTGVNAQQRLLHLFHLDSPWYPADLEQREGRIIRQGNKNPLVNVHAYAAKGTYDENMWKMLASKQFFIDQALSGDQNLRELEDLDSQSQYDMAAAMVAEDPRILQLAGAKAEIEKLQRLYQAHEDQRSRFRQQYQQATMTVEWNEKRLPEAEKQAAKVQDLSGDKFNAKSGKTTYTDRAKWAEALIEQYKTLTAKADPKPITIGEISGFPVVFGGETVAGQYTTKVMLGTPEPMLLIADAGTSAIGTAMRAQNAVSDVARLPARMRERITEARAQIDALQTRLEAPFPMAGMLADKVKEASDLEAQIAADGKPKTWRVERKSDNLGFDVEAVSADEAIMKAVSTNGGAAEDWVAIEAKEQKPAEDTRLARGAGAGGMDVDALDALTARIQAKNPNLPRVHVLSDPSKAPKALREYINRQDAWHDVEGAFHEGELYLFASGLSDPLRAEHVLAEHEAGHFGLRALLGDKLPTAMNLVYAQNAAVRKAVADLQKRGKLTNVEATEEVLVDIPSADLAKLKGWRKVVQMAADWLAAHGYDRMAQKLSDWLDGTLSDQQRADLFVAELVRGAREYVAGKRPGSARGLRGTRLSTTLAEDIAKQEQWLQSEARARGFKDIEDLLEKDYPLFEKLATLWREKNPADTLLSRGQAKKTATERADEILAAKTGSVRPLDAAARMLTRVTGLERLTGSIYDRAAYLLNRYTPETVKAGLVADYGVPQAVIDQRVLLQGRQRVQLRKAGELIDKLSTLTREESRVAYEWMNMDGEDPKAYLSMMQGLPEESVMVLTDVQKMIDSLSKEAVRLGQLSTEAYEKNRFAYLRRSYAKHILEQTAGEKAKRSRVISILGDQYKGRGMTESAAMDKIKAAAPEWWGRKLKDGKADTALKGEKFIRLERRAANGQGVNPLPGMTGKADGRLLEIAYWPAGEKIPAKYAEWSQVGTWEVRDVKGPNAIFWRDYTKDERELMGEVDEARFAIAKTLHGMIHDVEVGRYLEWMAVNQAKKEGETIPGVVVEASERYRDTFKPNDWVRVPDTKIPGTSVLKYGKLAGRYLPGPVWNDLRQVVGGQFKPFGDTYSKILSLWKTSKTALSPAVHMNNVMSNFVMADWHDVSASHIAKSLRILLAASQREGKGLIGNAGNLVARGGISDREAAREILARYTDSGGDIGSWVTNEIAQNQLEPMLESLEKELQVTAGASMQAQTGVFAALQHALMLRFPSAWEAFKPTLPGRVVRTEAQNLIDLYQSEDDVFRLAAWLKAKEEGASDIDAGKNARKSFLDYHINAPWVQAMRQSAWPFISFTYRAVPMLAEIAGKKPHKLMKLMLLAGSLNALGMMLAGGGDDDDERKLLPEEKAGKIWGMVPKLIRMPWNDQHGSAVYLDIRRFIPVGDVFDVGAGQSAVPVLPGLQPGGPLVLFGEVMLNKSAFTGKSITLDTDTASQKAAKVADHLYKAFAPNILGLPNTYATDGVVGSLTGRTDAFGREMSTAQAVASSFGIKLGSYPADVLRRNLVAKSQSEIMEVDKNISQLKRQRQTGRLDDEEFQSKVQVEQTKKQRIMQELGEKLN